ncbi:MAG: hypothetical protein QMD86_01035 [Patescibacteria group bacterium]|nr:hypothetical protein [Patescibacteria group bacterium]
MIQKGKKYQYNPKVFKKRDEEREFPKGAKGILVCKICGALYHKKSWNRSISIINKNDLDKILVRSTICPACAMIKNKEFEGELIISNIPKEHSNKIAKIIEDVGTKGRQRDIQHRLIAIYKNKNSLRAITTENQLTVEMARKIKDVFKNKINEKISYSPNPSDVVYVRVEFKN